MAKDQGQMDDEEVEAEAGLSPEMGQPIDLSNEIVENEDGSATFIEGEDEQESEFDANLAESLPDSDLNRIARDLIELIGIDKESLKAQDELYAEGLKRTGLADDAPGGATFEGASKAVHPVLAESCIDYAASAIKELFPPDGPVKVHNFAESVDPNDIEVAENKRDFMNWQLVSQVPEYRTELEVLLTQQPLAGSQYLKFWWDANENRPCVEFVPSDRVYLPFAATSFQIAERVTLVVPLTRLEYEARVRSGLYRDLEFSNSEPFIPDESQSKEAADKIEGKSEPTYNEDGMRNFYEVYVTMSLDEEEDPAPYIITIDEYTEKIAAIYRNWDEEDELRRKLNWVVDFCFIPWRGAKGIGLTHLIGSLAGAATGALRALLDAAHLNNFPGAIKLKGARASGQNVNIGATEITEIDAPAGIDDIRKIIMPLPFNQPSPVLFQLLGWLTDAAKGVVSTAEEKIADASNQMPVGTALALIEQGSKVASAIHMRLHNSQRLALEIVQRLNFKYYNEEIQIQKFGRVLVPREGFLDTGNVVPVSDPFMFSESQRFAQMQGVLQMAQDPSVPWNKIEIYKRLLRLMHVQSPQEFIQEPPPPVSADPVTEIVAAMSGQQIQATPDMDQMHHIHEQLAFLLDPLFGAANPALVNPGFQLVMNDVFQHLLFQYQAMKTQSQQMAQQRLMDMAMSSIMQRTGGQMPQDQAMMIAQQQMQSPQAQQAIMQMANQAFAQMQQQMMPLLQQIQQANELVKSKVPPPQDPQAQAAMQVAQMQEQTKMQVAQIRAQLDQAKLQLQAQNDSAKIELEKLVRTSLDPELKRQQMQTEIAKNEADNQQHSQTEIIKNMDDNRTNLEIAGLREQGATDRKLQESYQRAAMDALKLDHDSQESDKDRAVELYKESQNVDRKSNGEGKSD